MVYLHRKRSLLWLSFCFCPHEHKWKKKPWKPSAQGQENIYLPLFLIWCDDGRRREEGDGCNDPVTPSGTQPLYGEDVSITLLPWKASINTHTHTLEHNNTFTSRWQKRAAEQLLYTDVLNFAGLGFRGEAEAPFCIFPELFPEIWVLIFLPPWPQKQHIIWISPLSYHEPYFVPSWTRLSSSGVVTVKT